jgi:hypothetical protein
MKTLKISWNWCLWHWNDVPKGMGWSCQLVWMFATRNMMNMPIDWIRMRLSRCTQSDCDEHGDLSNRNGHLPRWKRVIPGHWISHWVPKWCVGKARIGCTTLWVKMLNLSKYTWDYSIHETSDDGTIGYCPCTYDPSIMLILFHTISCYL